MINLRRKKAFIEREATQLAPKTLLKQLQKGPELQEDLDIESHLDDAMSSALNDDASSLLDSPYDPPSPPSMSPTGSVRSGFFDTVKNAFPKRKSMVSVATGGGAAWKDPQMWQVLKAVETKDVMFLMEVRDRAFHVRG